MDETETNSGSRGRTWLKRLGLALAGLLLLLALFHRPLLQTLGRNLAIHFATGQNLKLDFRLEGSILGGVELHNVHAVATGPSALQSLDADLVRVDYSLWGLLTQGMPGFLQEIEIRQAAVVLDSAKAPPTIEPQKEQKFSLPGFFPDRITLADVSVRMISQPNDFILEHLSLDLNPEKPGELRIAKLQLPNGRSWSEVTAQTSYVNRNLYLRNLVLDDQTQLEVVNVDASQINANKLGVRFSGTVAGGAVSGGLSLGEKDQSMQTNVELAVKETSLDKVGRYFGQEAPGVVGDVRELEVKGSGLASSPRTWTGTVKGEIENLVAGGATFDQAKIDVQAANGQADIRNVELRRGTNQVTLQGTAELPESMDGFGRRPATIQLRGKLPELGEITADLPQRITGSAEINGQVKVENETIHADIALAGGPIDFGQGTAQKFVVKLQAAKKMPPPKEVKPYFAGLSSEITAEVSELRAQDYAVDSLHAEVRSAEQQLTIEQLLVRRKANELALKGRYELPADFAQAAAQPATVEFLLTAPQVGDFWASDSANKVTGELRGSGRVNYQQRLGDGWFNLFGEKLQARNLTIEQLSAQGTTANDTVYLNDLSARLNAQDVVAAHGQVEAKAPFAYSGNLAVNIASLATFEPMLKAAGKDVSLGGALTVHWQGNGVATKFHDTGNLKLTLENGRYGDLQKLEAKIDARYSPEALNVPIVYLASDKTLFQAIMQTREQKLEISEIQVYQGEAKYAGGYVAIPFHWENLGTEKPVLPSDGPVLVSFQSENLDLQKLAKDFGMTPPVAGAADLKIDAQGTLQNLRATLDLRMTGLRSDKLQNFQPATFVVGARVQDDQLQVTGKLEQARIEPVQIEARMPLPLARMIETKSLEKNTPINAQVRMPRSSINFVRQFVPALERIDGNMALNVDLGGTIAAPVISGSAEARINVARMSSPTLPALTNFDGRLNFDGKTLNFAQFTGELAGGKFALAGQITFPKITEPIFDLRFTANDALVARNDNLTARTDADVRIAGPLNQAKVSGKIALTNSHFLKDIDLIPIGLPGRPPPAPEPPSAAPELSFPNPPLRDWTFDLAIETKDPFSIRGNLAQGGAIVDMKLTGTGLRPQLQGLVRLENVEATLPFSRLEITQGFLYFNPDDPLNPRLDLQGTSIIRDYTIRVYIYGTVDSPEAVFTSEPPLPQEEIISLLATGTTREELLAGGNALAGRGLMLLGQQLYRKIFKKSGEPKSSSIFDRLQLDLGKTDPKTGQQTATARFKVNQNIVLVGDLGVQGDFRGKVKYLIRFR